MEDKSFRSLVLLQERIARRVREGAEYSTEKEAYHWVMEEIAQLMAEIVLED
ncbi:hypothetical protein [Enterocloster lavalensis]|uniref:hypothetical protein n=1 Tax=Enterocloster lavalensis TaxID=460384 RepID=UPI002666E34D|nr:hypothetical protein [Enterocloster lavalensis]